MTQAPLTPRVAWPYICGPSSGGHCQSGTRHVHRRVHGVRQHRIGAVALDHVQRYPFWLYYRCSLNKRCVIPKH